MLRSIKEIFGYRVEAQDGRAGKVADLLFTDGDWRLRYLVVDTGGWLEDRKVLVPRQVLGRPEWAERSFPVRLSRRQIETGPPLAAEAPISRQHEAELLRHLALDPYWIQEMSEAAELEGSVAGDAHGEPRPLAAQAETESGLRSCRELGGYSIAALDGNVGEVEDFIIDDAAWLIRYLAVDTRVLLPGKKVLLATAWVHAVDWPKASVIVDLTREAVRECPAYDPGQPVNREQEEVLYDYFGRPRYWVHGEQKKGGK
jgi:hypothetical protein